MNAMQKALIGASGGVALVLLKLIEVQFFVDDISSRKAIAAFLTYGAYIVLGVIVAIFFTDDSLEDGKRKKSAFVAGLLAPSLLIAILRQPLPGPGAEISKPDPSLIPKIGMLFISPAYSQTPATKPSASKSPQPAVVELKRDDVEPSFGDGVKAAIGRAAPSKSYFYVLGQADSKDKAVSAAMGVNKLIEAQKGAPGTSAYVIRPEGTDKWFVTVGKNATASTALDTRAATQSAAVGALTSGTATQMDRTAAKLVLDGKVVNGSAFFSK